VAVLVAQKMISFGKIAVHPLFARQSHFRRAGFMGYKLAAALCMQIVLMGFVSADTLTYADRFIFDMDQRVQGNGFCNAYLNIAALNLSLSNQGHGSGSYNYESLLKVKNGAEHDDSKGDYKSVIDRSIELEESADLSYAPTSFYLGKSMKWSGFQSHGMEKTSLKNYGSAVSMNALFDHISVISKNISASLLWKSSSDYDVFGSSMENHGRSSLNVEGAFTGKGHIGAQMLGSDQHDSDTLIDEDYLGTYSISKRMAHEVTYKLKGEADDWLPCCSSGFADMNLMDQKPFKSASGVFDCTCFKPSESS
jgi:hypothetical protein